MEHSNRAMKARSKSICHIISLVFHGEGGNSSYTELTKPIATRNTNAKKKG